MTSPPGHDFDAVRHDGHAVQRGLSIEQHDVAILQMPLHDVPHLHPKLPEPCQHTREAAPWLQRAAKARQAGMHGQVKSCGSGASTAPVSNSNIALYSSC